MQRFATLSTEVTPECLESIEQTGKVLIGTEDLIRKHLPTAVEGCYKNGQRYWLTNGFIIFEKKYEFKVNDEIYRLDLEDGYVLCFNTIEVNDLYAIRSNGLYLPSLKTSTWTEILYHKTDIAKAEREEEERKKFEAISNALRAMDIEPNDETIALYKRILGFDYYFDYIEQAAQWRRWNDEEKDLDSKLKAYPALADLKASFYKRGSTK